VERDKQEYYIMQISQKTIDVLSNFSTINPQIMIRSGNTITCVSSNKTVLARSVVPDEFPIKFGIYNLSRFLSILSIFKAPNLNFTEKWIDISETVKPDTAETGRFLTYYYADENIITAAPEKLLTMPSVDVELKLTAKVFSDIIKGASILNLPEICIFGDGSHIYVQAFESKNPNSDVYKIMICESDKVFKCITKVENISKIKMEDYDIQLSTKGISYFKNDNVEYWIVLEGGFKLGGE
jgi:hypothetical protein